MKRYMSELRDALRLGHSGGEGKRGGTKDPSPAWSEQRRRRDVGAGVGGFQTQPYYQILDTEKILFQNVFGDRDARVHRCTEPNAGKDF